MYMSRLGPLQIVKQTNLTNSASVIFFHGSVKILEYDNWPVGDTGKGVLNWIKFLINDFSLPHVKFIFPTAPLRSYIPSEGEMQNVWFNRYGVNPEVPEHTETLAEIKDDVKSLISAEINTGIPLNKIILGGFSMGGALALHTAYGFIPGIAGVFALSSFLNNESMIYKNIQGLQTPLFMCHGDKDLLVPLTWAQSTYSRLTNLGVKGEFHILTNTYHELKKMEMEMLLAWISETIPPPS